MKEEKSLSEQSQEGIVVFKRENDSSYTLHYKDKNNLDIKSMKERLDKNNEKVYNEFIQILTDKVIDGFIEQLNVQNISQGNRLISSPITPSSEPLINVPLDTVYY